MVPTGVEFQSATPLSANNLAMAFDTTATLKYFLSPPDGSRLYANVDADSVAGKPVRNWIEKPHDVHIEDVRGKEALYKLDSAGFQFGREAAKHTSFLDDDEIQNEYYPESIDLIKKVTGTSNAVIFDHSTLTINLKRFLDS
jgi:hypothetical protein